MLLAQSTLAPLFLNNLVDTRIRRDWVAKGYTAFKLRTGTLQEGRYKYGIALVPFGVTTTGRRNISPSEGREPNGECRRAEGAKTTASLFMEVV